MKILVVDDESDIVDLVSSNLQREGYRVVPAYTGEEALDLVRTIRPDLMVLDLMLPGMQGLEVCRLVRANGEYSNMPIIILSARDSEVDRILGLEMGADDYITKPFSVRELVSRIRVALRRVKGEAQKSAANGSTFSNRGLFIDFERYEVMVK